MPEETGTRERIIALLRSLADLLESDQEVPSPGVDASFFPETLEHTQAIMAGLALPWEAGKNDSRYRHLNGKIGSSINGFDVTIFACAGVAGTGTGVREVPVWELRPEIAALLTGAPRDAATPLPEYAEPPGIVTGPEYDGCGARVASGESAGGTFGCTLAAGHAGDHVAGGARSVDEPPLTWPQPSPGKVAPAGAV
jgi:hypothetical protein